MPEPIALALGWVAAPEAFALAVVAAGASLFAFDYLGTSQGIGLLSLAIGGALYAIMEGYARGQRKIREAKAGDALARIEALERDCEQREARVRQVAAEFETYKAEATTERARLDHEVARLTHEAEAANDRFARAAHVDLQEKGFAPRGILPSPDAPGEPTP